MADHFGSGVLQHDDKQGSGKNDCQAYSVAVMADVCLSDLMIVAGDPFRYFRRLETLSGNTATS